MKPSVRQRQDLWAELETAPSHNDATQSARPLWREGVRMRDRFRRTLTTPVIAVVIIVVLSLLISVSVVWAKPHEPDTNLEHTGFTTQQDLDATEQSPKSSASDMGEAPESSSTAEAPSGAEVEIVVHVVGEVKTPGLYSLPQGARVADAITAAGGELDTAYMASLNIARLLTDGEQIQVLTFEQTQSMPLDTAPDEAAPNGATENSSGQKVSINTANETELQQLPGIGPALANRIVQWREENGQFGSIDELTNVSGIGDKTLEKMREQLAL